MGVKPGVAGSESGTQTLQGWLWGCGRRTGMPGGTDRARAWQHSEDGAKQSHQKPHNFRALLTCQHALLRPNTNLPICPCALVTIHTELNY